MKHDFSSGISRRALLAGIAGGVALAVAPAAIAATNPVFRHGVASGDPDNSSVVIWTRVTPSDPVEAVAVAWEIAATPDFEAVLLQGSFRTDADRDHTVKVLVAGLAPGGTYYYRFTARGMMSPVGRARTLPTGPLDRVGIALASCSNYAFGYFNAYGAIARDPAIDFVLHTGDYIYEYAGKDGWGADVARSIGRVHEPAHEIVTLADYRMRHAQYKSDTGSQAMHAAHSLLACWDDHESTNNPWVGGAENHQPETEGDWVARREASIRAYYEWMPVREPRQGRTRAQFWRRYDFGDLAMLHTLETRHTGRAKQIDYRDHAASLTSSEAATAFKRDVLGAPDRPMLAPELEADLETALKESVAAGQPWRIIGTPMLIARVEVPDVAAMGILPDPMPKLARASAEERLKLAADPAVAFAWKGKWNLPDYTDAWGGYGWARERFYALAQRAGASDLLFLAGDSHSFWANQVADSSGKPMGVELGTAGISSPGDFVGSGFDDATARRLDRAYAKAIPEVVWTDNMHQGYVRVELAPNGGTASFVAVETVLKPDDKSRVIRRFSLLRNGSTIAIEPQNN